MSSSRSITLLLLLLLLAALGLWRWQASPTPPATERLSVSFGLALQPTDALAILAQEQGLFAAAGLEVELIDYPSGKRALREGLLSGRVELATSADIPLVLALLEGAKLGILASIASADNVNRIIARRDHGIALPADLSGKRIATQQASAVHYFLDLFLTEQGVRDDSVRQSYLAAEQLTPALLAGEIDAFSMRQPYIGQAHAALGDNAVIFSLPGGYPQSEFLVATPRLLAERPEVARRALAALLQAEAFAHAQPQQALALVARRLGIAPDELASSWAGMRLEVRLDQSALLLLEGEARWAIERGLCSQCVVPDFFRCLHTRALEQLAPTAITVIR